LLFGGLLACALCGAANAEPLSQSEAAAIVAKLRAPAEQPLTDHEEQEFQNANHGDHWRYVRKFKDVCDGRERPDGVSTTSQGDACNQVGAELSVRANDPSAGLSYFLKACRVAIDANDPQNIQYCSNATRPQLQLSTAIERAIWMDCHTTSCLNALAASLENVSPKDLAAAALYAKQGCEQATSQGNGSAIQQACERAQRLGSIQDISGGEAQAQQQNKDYHQRIADQNEHYREGNARLDQQMANNQAMVDAVTHNGNLISETANQQTAAILAYGNAGARRNAAPRTLQSPSYAPQPIYSQQPAPSYSQQSNPSYTTSTNSGSGTSGQSSDPNQYTSALPASCVNSFWDSKYYGWLSFQNNCGQAIHLGYISQNGTGAFGGSGGSATIEPGASVNTGQSQAEVQAAGGGFILFVCPAGYVATAANGGNLSATNTSFRCKKW